MKNDLSITTPLDQDLPADIEDVLDQVDSIIQYSIELKNPDVVFSFCANNLQEIKRSLTQPNRIQRTSQAPGIPSPGRPDPYLNFLSN